MATSEVSISCTILHSQFVCIRVYSLLQFIISRLVQHQQLELPTALDATVVEDKDLPDAVIRQRRMTMEQQVDEKRSQRMRVEHLDFRNDENKTPLHLAAISGHME